MLYLDDIKPLEDQGLTDAEIAALISASTLSDIPIADLENFFDFEGLAKRNALTGAWEGTLPDEVTTTCTAWGLALQACLVTSTSLDQSWLIQPYLLGRLTQQH